MLVVKNPPPSARRLKRHRFDPWVRKILWRRKWQPTSVFLPREFHEQRSLGGYSPWGGRRVRYNLVTKQLFPGSSVGKESACNAVYPSSIPVSGRSPGEGIGYPLQDSWASLVAQLVKNLPAMWETWVRFLGWEDPLEKRKVTHSSILAWRIPWAV